ncbi:MAG TPA: ROK family protein [Clostridiales bacterium]|nr:ROK family protein [Clostridiales bacterium]
MYYLGIDLGGTNIVAGVVDENYKIMAKAECKTAVPRPESEICESMAAVAKKAVEKAKLTMNDIKSIGIGVPGAVNPKTGKVEYSANLFFHNWEIVKMMKSLINKPVVIENDANAAAYGEFLAGSAKGANNAIAITLGTGVGAGIIIDGKIYSGSNYAGAEMGHMVIVKDGKECACGRKGCWEAYASATGLIALTKEAILQEKPDFSYMLKSINGDINKISGLTAFNAMRAGDAAGKQVVDKYIEYLACGIVNAVNIFQPDILCIGGGISKEGETLLAPLRALVEQYRYTKHNDKQTKIVSASLGNDAGIIGAALLPGNE